MSGEVRENVAALRLRIGRRQGQITYSHDYGHVCTCTERIYRDAGGRPDAVTYEPSVRCDRNVDPYESGSWWYTCERCGAGAWSGL